jgi:hypothetical protein
MNIARCSPLAPLKPIEGLARRVDSARRTPCMKRAIHTWSLRQIRDGSGNQAGP